MEDHNPSREPSPTVTGGRLQAPPSDGKDAGWSVMEIVCLALAAAGVGIGIYTDALGFVMMQFVAAFWIFRARYLRRSAKRGIITSSDRSRV